MAHSKHLRRQAKRVSHELRFVVSSPAVQVSENGTGGGTMTFTGFGNHGRHGSQRAPNAWRNKVFSLNFYNMNNSRDFYMRCLFSTGGLENISLVEIYIYFGSLKFFYIKIITTARFYSKFEFDR